MGREKEDADGAGAASSGGELLAEIRNLRRNGYALNDEEEEIGTCGVAVPVFNPSQQFVAALEVAGPRSQIQDAGLPQLVLLAKDSTRELQILTVQTERSSQEWTAAVA